MDSIVDLADRAGVNLADLIQRCSEKKVNVDYYPNDEKVKDIHEVLSNFYKLDDHQMKQLWESMNSGRAKFIIDKYAPFMNQKSEKNFMKFLAKKIFDELGDEFQLKIDEDINQFTIETVLGLGRMKIRYSNAVQTPLDEIPKELLSYDPNFLNNLIIKRSRRFIEHQTTEDYDLLRNKLQDEKINLLNEIKEVVPTEDFETYKDNIEDMVLSAYSSMQKVIDLKQTFDQASESDLKLAWHQALRISALTERKENGDFKIKRSVLNDCTGGGKTFSMLGTYAVLKQIYQEENKNKQKEDRRGTKALIVAPNQAIHSVWGKKIKKDEIDQWDINKYMRALGLPDLRVGLISTKADIPKFTDPDYDIMLINYEKLALMTSTENGINHKDIEESNEYIEAVKNNMNQFLYIGVDEGHRLKNVKGKTNGSFVEVVDKSIASHFTIATATTIPCRPKDAGFILYMKRPDKYMQYRKGTLDVRTDFFSIFNEVNSIQWFEWDIEDNQHVFDLGPLPTVRDKDLEKALASPVTQQLEEWGLDIPKDQYIAPYEIESDEIIHDYFRKWDEISPRKLSNLSEILLKASIPEIQKIVKEILDEDPRARIGIFTRHQECFTDKMITALTEIGYGDKLGIINGTEDPKSREETARKYQNNELKIVLCSNQISESFSLISGEDDNYFILAEPSVEPGVYTQIRGRGYRKLQKGSTYMVHLMSHSSKLEKLMQEHVAAQGLEGIHARKTFQARTLFEDIYLKRIQRLNIIQRARQLKNPEDIFQLCELTDKIISEEGCNESTFPSLAKPKKGAKREFDDITIYTHGFQASRHMQGKSVDELIQSEEGLKLLKGYSIESLMNTTVGKTAAFVSTIIEEIENQRRKEDPNFKLDKILDWGCGSACLARYIKDRKIISLDAFEEMLMVGKYFLDKDGIDCEYLDSSKASMTEINQNIDKRLLIKGYAQKMPFQNNSIDFVTNSYALMYNEQGLGERQVEEIILETNRVLKPNGYGLIVLPRRSAERAVDGIRKIIQKYGFKTIIEGKYIDAPGFRGSRCLLFKKQDNKNSLQDWEDVEPVILEYEAEIYSGGLRKSKPRKRKTTCNVEPTELDPNIKFIVNDTHYGPRGKLQLNPIATLNDYIRDVIEKD